MNQLQFRSALNRALITVYRSLPMYLASAAPFRHPGDEKAAEALRLITADQQALAQRIGEHLVERYGRADLGGFPMEFTDTHDLAVEFLLKRLVESARHDVAALRACAAALQGDAAGHALALEALGAAQGHLETLQELLPQAASA
jgi:hypothetical protein